MTRAKWDPTDSRAAFARNLSIIAAHDLQTAMLDLGLTRPKGSPYQPIPAGQYYFEKGLEELRAGGTRADYRLFAEDLLKETLELRKKRRELRKRKVAWTQFKAYYDELGDSLKDRQTNLAQVREAYWSPEARLSRATKGIKS